MIPRFTATANRFQLANAGQWPSLGRAETGDFYPVPIANLPAPLAGFRSLANMECGGIEAIPPGGPTGQPTIRRYENVPHMGGRRRFAVFG